MVIMYETPPRGVRRWAVLPAMGTPLVDIPFPTCSTVLALVPRPATVDGVAMRTAFSPPIVQLSAGARDSRSLRGFP